MPLSPNQRHKLLMADKTQDADWIAAVVLNVLAANRDATLFEIEMAFRDGAAQSYLIAGPGQFQVITGGTVKPAAANCRQHLPFSD